MPVTSDSIDLADFDFDLPQELIAQSPLSERDAARMLVVDPITKKVNHSRVHKLSQWLRPGDLLVRNCTKVLSARLRGRKESGGQAEALLLGPEVEAEGSYRALVRCGGRLRPGLKFFFGSTAEQLEAEIQRCESDGSVVLNLTPPDDPYRYGEAPLPPYIRRSQANPDDLRRYQTEFAREPGSVAAPTAGLHFSQRLLEELATEGIGFADVILHVGAGTFRPLSRSHIAKGELHAEQFQLPDKTVEAIQRVRANGGRVVAVGTTSARVLESCISDAGELMADHGETRLFLRPGQPFRVVDALFTNFHLPRSSLLLLVCAFGGRELILDAYQNAIAAHYRFFSYGDAMLIQSHV